MTRLLAGVEGPNIIALAVDILRNLSSQDVIISCGETFTEIDHMATLLQVNYRPSAQQNQLSDAERVESAERIANNVAGLQWKVWISNAADKLRGGIYLFDNLDSARAWGEGNLRDRLAAGGGTNISITYFDVDEKLSAITRAALVKASLAA